MKSLPIACACLFAASHSLMAQSYPSLRAEPASLSFTMQSGGSPPPVQQISITSTGAALTYRVAATTESGGDWLYAGPFLAGNTPGSLVIGLNPSPVVGPMAAEPPRAPGTYRGAVVITAAGAVNSPFSVPVTLTVTPVPGLPQLVAAPSAISLSMQSGGSPPPVQTISITSTGAPVSYTVSVQTDSGGGWLYAGPYLAGNTPGSLTVGLNPSPIVGGMGNAAALPPGTYKGAVKLTSAGASNSPLSISVTLTVTPAVPNVAKVANAASNAVGPLAPGEIVAIQGSNLGPDVGVSFTPAAAGTLDTTLSGVRVLLDDAPLIPIYVSSTQVNAIVPQSAPQSGTGRLRVVVGAAASPPVEIALSPAAPAIFTLDRTGAGPAAILNQNFSVNSAANPAARGSIVMIYVTGMGTTDPPTPDGRLVNSTSNLAQNPAVSIGGQSADVLYAGPVVGLVPGVFQLNARIPLSIPPGAAVPVSITIAGRTTPAGPTLAIL